MSAARSRRASRHVLHRPAVLRHPGDGAQVGDAPKSEHQVLEADLVVRVKRPPSRRASRGPVDLLDRALEDVHAPAELAERIDHVDRGERGSRHLGEHRLEDEDVALRDERDAPLTLGPPQRPAQRPRAIGPGKSPSCDDDVEFHAP